jgi:hypothetical protein
MNLQQVSENCFAVLCEKNRVCDANSGFINRGGGVVVDTQSDLSHARQMIELFGKVWREMPKRVINTHEDADQREGKPTLRVYRNHRASNDAGPHEACRRPEGNPGSAQGGR